MPFDPSGNFTRVHSWQQDRDNGIRILADRHDAEDDNFGSAFNLTFLRTGTVPMTGDLQMGLNNIKSIKAGSEAAPSLTWALSNQTGIFQPNSTSLGFSSNGVKKFEVNGSGVSIFGDTAFNGDLGVIGTVATPYLKCATIYSGDGGVDSAVNIWGGLTPALTDGAVIGVRGVNFTNNPHGIDMYTGGAKRFSMRASGDTVFTGNLGVDGTIYTYSALQLRDDVANDKNVSLAFYNNDASVAYGSVSITAAGDLQLWSAGGAVRSPNAFVATSIQSDGNILAMGTISTKVDANSGGLSMNHGGSGLTGYLSFHAANNTRIGYIGNASTAAGQHISYFNENGGGHSFSGPIFAGLIDCSGDINVEGGGVISRDSAAAGNGVLLAPGDGTRTGNIQFTMGNVLKYFIGNKTPGGAISFYNAENSGHDFNGPTGGGPIYARGGVDVIVAGTGGVRLSYGSATNSGLIAFLKPDGTRCGYIGFMPQAANGNIEYQSETGGSHNFGQKVFCPSLAVTDGTGTGRNIAVGDDAWIGDINIANCLGIRGQTNFNAGFVTFGNCGQTLGNYGTDGLLYYTDGITSLAGKVTANNGMISSRGANSGIEWSDRGDNNNIWNMYANSNYAHMWHAGDKIEIGDTFIRPTGDANADCGSSGHRWNAVWCVSPSNTTSDARQKDWRGGLNATELAVAKDLIREIGVFRWLRQIEEEGDNAKFQIGMVAQQVIAVFERHDLDWHKYQLVRYDEWEESTYNGDYIRDDSGEPVTDENGTPLMERIVKPAGNEYSVTYNDLTLFMMVAMDQRLAYLEGYGERS